MTKLPQSILVTGMAQGLAKVLLDNLLLRAPHLHLLGIDPRPVDYAPPHGRVKFMQFNYSRNELEKIFSNYRFDMAIHLGRLGLIPGDQKASLLKQLNLDVSSTNTLIELSIKYKLRKIIILSSFHVYGANPAQGQYFKESHPILERHPDEELQKLIDMDTHCQEWFSILKRQQTEIILLRPCLIVGPHIKNAISYYLKTNYVPFPFDYDPKLQFIHEQDLARLIILAIKYLKTGAYNLAPDETIRLSEAKNLTQTSTIPYSFFLWAKFPKLARPFWNKLPPYLLDFLRYGTIISNEKIKKELPHHDLFEYSTKEALNHLIQG